MKKVRKKEIEINIYCYSDRNLCHEPMNYESKVRRKRNRRWENNFQKSTSIRLFNS